MGTIEELKKIRIKKLNKIKDSFLFPYPGKTKRTHEISKIIKDFTQLEKEKKEIVLVGRIKSLRKHGGITFFDIEDGTGKIQASLRKNKVGEHGYQFFLENFDIGDFVEVRGILFKTKTKEKTIEVILGERSE